MSSMYFDLGSIGQMQTHAVAPWSREYWFPIRAREKREREREREREHILS